jgi:acyl-CoA reductase-like NAD-dependent aldehyde dehydrogenase
MENTMATNPVTDESNLRVIEKFDPTNGEKLGDFPIASADEVNAAVARAREAFPAWRALSLKERLRRLEKVREVIAEEGEYIARRISEDTGKPLVDSLMTELITIPVFIDYYIKTAPKVLGRHKVKTPILFPGKSSYIEHFPMGVVAVISPWNFPFQLSVIPIISALIPGNTVVLKPSEVTPITGEVIAEVFERAGLPDGVVEVVHGDGSTGAALTEADVDKIFFTGSVATGRKVMAAAAKKPIPVELELGGKDAFIVCHDANLERAAKAAAWGGLINCGQMCTSVERVMVVESVYDEFMAKLEHAVKKVKVGTPDEEADMGPMTFPHQIKIVERHVEDAREKGATIVTGGKRIDRKGTWYEPTLLTDVTPDMEIYVEETFGPVIPVVKVKDEEEAIRLANDHQYGLNGSVWSQDTKRAIELASRMECGQVTVNDVVLSVGNPVLPFGGVKASGIGRYHGPEGLLSFTHQKAIMVDKGWGNKEPFWFPYGGKYDEMVSAFKSLLGGNLPKALLSLLKLRGMTD